MAEWQNGGNGGMAEWWNGGMAEWQNCGMAERRNGNRMAEMVEWRNGGMAGMAVRRKEWQNGRMAEMATYVLFMVHTDDYTYTDDDVNDTF